MTGRYIQSIVKPMNYVEDVATSPPFISLIPKPHRLESRNLFHHNYCDHKTNIIKLEMKITDKYAIFFTEKIL